MPVTFPVADHASNAYETRFNPTVTTREDLFAQTCPDEAKLSSRIIQSSISESTFQESKIRPSVNGFVKSAWDAYSSHHHLTIRPDDIWFAILSQLNFYINANAEDLREYFVEHKDKKELIIEDVGTIDTVDFGAFARQMTGLIQQNVKDPNLRDWMMPAFSTTKVDDRTTAAILMMGSLQAYFSYTSMLTCGIPSVTLLGEREDYQDILERLDKLDELGPQTKDWAALLRPILRMFVASFDDAATSEVKNFWSKIAHYRGGSGMSHLSGWITAFCFWRKDGNSLYYRTAPKFHDAYTPNKVVNIRMGRCELGGVTYHTIDTHDIPNGFADVPVKVNDNGKIHETKMVAGSMAIQIDKSGDKGEDGEEKWDSVRSLSGWVMYKIKSKKEMDEARKEHAAKNPFGSQW